MRTIEKGCKVAFARAFLRSTMQYTGQEAPTHYGPFARGVVTDLETFAGSNHALVSVLWADGATTRVLGCNLVAVNRMHLEPV